MYTWIIDYGYLTVITILFFVSPIAMYFVDIKVFKYTNKLRVIIFAFIFFSVFVVSLLALKSFHIHFIQNICFDYPVIAYKNSNIPDGCYNFDTNKYMGIGWTLKAIYWIFLEFIYLIFIYVAWIIYNKKYNN